VLFDELVYVEARLNYVILHTETRNLMVYLTIKGMAEQLPADRFLRIHKSTLVNTGKITSIEGNTLHAGGSVLLISQGLQEDVLKQIVKDRMIKR
jgi:DNA-binding LytR/AlgR family response regulator